MKSFKQFITEGKYDTLKKELMNSEGMGQTLSGLKQLLGMSYYNSGSYKYSFYLMFQKVVKHDVDDRNMIKGKGWLEFLRPDKVRVYNHYGSEIPLEDLELTGPSNKILYTGGVVTEVNIPEGDNLLSEMIKIKIDNTKSEDFKQFWYPEKIKARWSVTLKFPLIGIICTQKDAWETYRGPV
jgi:hypothetical protein